MGMTQTSRGPVMALRAFQELRNLLALAQRDVGLFPIASAAEKASLPFHLAVGDARPDAGDLRTQQLLDRVFDLDLVGAGCHFEDERLAILTQDGRLLGD